FLRLSGIHPFFGVLDAGSYWRGALSDGSAGGFCGRRRAAGAGYRAADAAFLRADRQARGAGGGQCLRDADDPPVRLAALLRSVLPPAFRRSLRRLAEPAAGELARLR